VATLRLRYVDTDVVGGAGNGTSWANAYASLNAAEQAEDNTGVLTTTDEYVEFDCKGVTLADVAQATVSGWTTDATRYISIYTEQANRHDGKWNTAQYRLSLANASVFLIWEDYVRLDGLQVQKTASSNPDQSCIQVTGQNAANEIWISNCITRQAGNNSYVEAGIHVLDADSIVKIWNCVLYGGGTYASSYNAALEVQYCATVEVYSSTLIGGYRGLSRYGGTVTAKNCYATSIAGTVTQTNCATSDTTADGTDPHDSVAKNTDTFVNVTAGTEDFHLAADGLSPLQGHGVDTSGDAAPLNFTTDIDGQTRDATWDIGADAWYVAAGGTILPQMIAHHG